jgi:UDP-4-amino-4-deoxy-L-arabinose formyltransferase/UDP-glucuronic acid dehydrogenase (UDP-4-keto-hexauronic acid decarboxylating)
LSVVVFAYHDVGCLGVRTLARLGIDVAAVYTHADDPGENTWFSSVRAVCDELGLPVHVGVDPHAPAEMERIRALVPAAFFSFYYRNLLRDELLAIPAHGGVNLHGSLLPRYRGRAPVNWQLLHGERQGGVTLHYMVKKADAGDVVDQEPFEIGPDDRPTDVFEKILPAAERVLERSARAVVQGTAPRARQVESKATKFGRRGPADGLIDWRQAAGDVRNLVRAVTGPYPGAFTFAGERKLVVWWAELDAGTPRSDTPPGTVAVEGGDAFVACGDLRRLRLTDIEIEGSRRQGAAIAQSLRHGLQLTADAPEEARWMS